MKPRKSIPVVNLLWHVNYFLRNSKPGESLERQANISLTKVMLDQFNVVYTTQQLGQYATCQPGEDPTRVEFLVAELYFDYKHYADKKAGESVKTVIGGM